jgi:hypothetical protein
VSPCTLPAPAQGLVFQGSGWDTGLPEWVPERVDACTHTPFPYAYCAPRVGGFRTREDERLPAGEPCYYTAKLTLDHGVYLDAKHPACVSSGWPLWGSEP